MTAHRLTKALQGRWHGSYGTARCPAHDDKNPSLSITDGDGKLLVKCHAGCSQETVWESLARMGLFGGGGTYQTRPAPVRRSEPDREAEKRTAAARTIWATAVSATGTPVEQYFRSRGITITVPPTLRYHPALKHGPTGLLLPGMVAAVTAWPSREVMAIHRTFLTADGSDKAPVSQNRMMLGAVAGGAVRLAPAGPKLAVAEGIETSLSVQEATGLPVWAALSAAGITGLVLPELPLAAEVVIAADHDETGLRAAEQAAERWLSEGRKVWIAKPPEYGTDFNDLARDELSARKGFAA